MHRYEELEKLYYKKKYLRYFYVFISILLIGGIAFYVYSSQKPIHKKPEKVIKKQIKKVTIEINTTKKEVNVTKVNDDNNTKQKIVSKQIKKKKIIEKKLILYPIFPEINITKKEIKPKEIIKPKKIISTEKKVKLNIVVKTSKKTLKDLIYLYNKSPEYSTALEISKIYYSKKEYNNSIEWAKKANVIQPEDKQSWLIFAKSLIKLGKKKKAKEVLIAYLNIYGPEKEIEELLRRIK